MHATVVSQKYTDSPCTNLLHTFSFTTAALLRERKKNCVVSRLFM